MKLETNVYDLNNLKAQMKISGPAIILNSTSTILIEPCCEAVIDDFGSVEVQIGETNLVDDAKQYK